MDIIHIAMSSIWYEFYHEFFHGGRYIFTIKEMHDKYGPIVRVTPDELHVNDLSFIPELIPAGCRRRNNCVRLMQMFGLVKASAATIDDDIHRMRRGARSKFFSRESIWRIEPMVKLNIVKLFVRLWELRGQANRSIQTLHKQTTQLPTPQLSNSPTPQLPNSPTPQLPNSQLPTPQLPNSPTPQLPTPQLPNSPTPQLPNSPTPQLPNSPTPQLPNSPTPQLPNSPTPQLPNSPTPQLPTLQLPNSPTPQLPNSPTPQLPNSPTLQLPNSPTPQLPNSPTPQLPSNPPSQATPPNKLSQQLSKKLNLTTSTFYT
ncbi:hypothetical protein EAF00_008952 [Botryotinia globosa]|nr:hypothetical protein EAF00_008952 [Botryotinia globosa]